MTRQMQPQRFKFSCPAGFAAGLAAITLMAGAAATHGGEYYRDPSGGWSYIYTGDAAAGAPRRQNQPALDGTWRHETGSDEWNGDGRGPGNGPPGGVESFGGILTIEDAVTITSGNNNNRKFYFIHSLTQEGFTANNMIDRGVTLSFRVRLTPPDDKAEIPLPDGWGIYSDGKGMFGVRQSSPSSLISFSLVRASEPDSPAFSVPAAGLLMNRNNGDAANANVDAADAASGVTNLLALDPTVWHEFWITIRTNDATPGNGTHTVTIYVDGATTPAVFDVTAGTGNDPDTTVTPNWTDYIAIGLNNSPSTGAMDVDFYGYKAGLFDPTPVDLTVPAGFAQQPVSITVDEAATATFSVVVTGAPPKTIQWQRSDGAGSFTNIPGAVFSAYSLTHVQPPENGAVFRVLANNNINSIISDEVTLTVRADTTPPSVIYAVGAGTPPTSVEILFSEPVNNQNSVLSDPTTFAFETGSAVLTAVLEADQKTVHLTLDGSTSPVTNGTLVYLQSDIQDLAFTTNTLPAYSSFRVTVSDGSVRRQRYNDITGSGVSNLTQNIRFPNYPTVVDFPTALEDPSISEDTAANNNFGVQLMGYITPPISGNYNFFICSDDNSELWLSTDDQPANKRLIAFEPIYNSARMWLVTDRRNAAAPENRSSRLFPAGIPLVAGQRYYVEALMKEGSGGNNLAVTWQKPGDPLPANGSRAITNLFLSPYNVAVSLAAGQPADQTILVNRSATLSAVPSGSPLIDYQWYEDGLPIAGAAGRAYAASPITYTTPHLTTAKTYFVVISNSFTYSTSRVATITINPDSAPPVLLSASSVSSTVIDIRFDEPVELASATLPGNYIINGGAVTVSSVVLRADGQTAHLVLDPATPVSGGFTLQVQNVSDVAGNVMPAPASVSGLVWMSGYADIGAPLPAGEVFSANPGELEVTAGGLDVWGTSDQFTFVYQPRTNYFDVQVRVDSLPYVGNNWSKAGLNVRTGLDPASPMVWTYPTPGPVFGANQYEAGVRPTIAANTVDFGRQPRPTVDTYPAHVRVKRVGSTFTAYTSSNGVDWVVNGTTDQPGFPAELLVGPGTVSHIQSTAVTANYGQFGEVTLHSNAIIAVTQPLQDITAEENHVTTFTLAAAVTNAPASELGYQWQIEGTPGVGDFTNALVASQPSLTTPLLSLTDNGRRYRVLLLVPGASLLSAPATLTVVADTTAPKPVVAAGSCTGGNKITVMFDELMNPSTVSDTANFSLRHGATAIAFTNAAAGPDGISAILYAEADLNDPSDYYILSTTAVDLKGNPADNAEIVVSPAAGRLASGPDNLIVVEAENYDANVSQGGKNWVPFTDIAGYSGASAMDSVPNSGTANNEPNHLTLSPHLDYCVQFPVAGTYYVWIRGYGRSGSDDSLHVGLDNTSPDSFNWRVTGWGTSYSWQRNSSATPARVNVPTAGLHTFNVWMREDGTIVDKILLTTSSTYTPSGTGPAESVIGGGLPPAPQLSMTYTAGTLNIAWPITIGTLWEADEVTGPWTKVTGQTNPYSVSTTAARKFYRLTVP